MNRLLQIAAYVTALSLASVASAEPWMGDPTALSAYAFAKASVDGIGLSDPEAETFAKNIFALPNRATYFSTYETAYRYASRSLASLSLGLGMSYKNAMAFAQTAASMPDGSTYLKHHREILKTLSGEGEATVGHVAEASRIAADTATQPNPKEAIEQFHHKRREAQDRATTQAFETRKTNAERTVLAFATNTDTGLGLDRKAASEFLNQVAAHQDWAQFLSIYQAAVAYAHYEEQGLGVSIWEARKFADQVMTHSNPPEYLRHHKIALDYAYNEEGGLALSGASARKFADEVANRPNLDDYLRRHAIALAHAYNEESGLALSGAAAKNFADETVKRPDMEEYLQQHQAALAHAYGLGLSGTTARKYADEKYADEMVQQPNREQALRARAPVPPGSSSSRANWLNRFGRSAKIGGGTGFLVGAGLVGGSARTFVSG